MHRRYCNKSMTGVNTALILGTALFSIELRTRKKDFHFLSNLMEYDRCDSSPIDFEPNEIPLGSNQSVNGKYNLISV